MKCLSFFIHASVQNEIVDCLRSNDRVSGFTLTNCQGHSSAASENPFLVAEDRVMGYTPRIRIDVVLEEDVLEEVLEAVRASLQSGSSLGAWQVTDIVAFGRL